MRLTLLLLKSAGGSGRRAQGNMWIGKHRIAYTVYPHNLEHLKKKIKIEEENLFYLRHPYLTTAQEAGCVKELMKNEKWHYGRKIDDAARRMRLSVRMEDLLGHLNCSSSWEI